MKIKKGKTLIMVLLIVIWVAIELGHFIYNFRNISEPPSDKWAKAVKVGVSDNVGQKQVITELDKVIIVSSYKGKINLIFTDKNGSVIDTKNYDANSGRILNVYMLKKESGYTICYTYMSSGQVILEKMQLNKDFELEKKEKGSQTGDIARITDNLYVQYTDKQIQVINNTTEEVVFTSKDNKIDNVCTSTNAKSSLICYKTESSGRYIFKSIYIENDKFVNCKVIESVPMGSTQSYIGNLACAFKDDIAYTIIERFSSSEFVSSTLISYKPKSKGDNIENKIRDYNLPLARKLYHNIGISKDDGVYFYGVCFQDFAHGDKYENIVEYKLDEGQVKDANFSSKMRKINDYPYCYGNYLSYVDYGNEGYNIYLTSTEQSFKDANNEVKDDEVKTSIVSLIAGITYSLCDMLLIGAPWIVVALVLGAIYIHKIEYMEGFKKIILFSVLCILVLGAKLLSILRITLLQGGWLLPEQFKVWMLILLTIVIHVCSYLYMYMNIDIYDEKNILRYSVMVLVDAFITTSIFSPLIY